MKLKILFFSFMVIVLWSCASLGSKTLYLDESAKLPENTRIMISQPTLINVDQPLNEVQDILTSVVKDDLKEFHFTIEKSDSILPSFDSINVEERYIPFMNLEADYVLTAKIELLKSMNQTRDCKVNYKLISVKTGRLVFHSKYNTTVGASGVVFPGIMDYPDTDKIMLIGMSSGLYQFETKLMK